MSVLASTLFRSATLAVACPLLAAPLARLLAVGPRRRAALACTILVLAMPTLVVAYGYTLLPWPWTVSDPGREAIYDVLLLARGFCLAGLLLALLPPPPLPPESVFLARGARFGPVGRFRIWLGGPWRNRLLAGLVVFLIGFAEFALASRLSVSRAAPLAWTVALFDFHAVGGGELGPSLRWALPALAVQGLPVLLVVLLLAGGAPPERSVARRPLGPSGLSAAWGSLLAAAGVLVVLPLHLVVGHGRAGLLPALVQPGLLLPVAWSAFFATVAAGFVLCLVGLLQHRRWLLVPLVLPGLCGPLLVGLGLKYLLGAPGGAALAGSPVPVVLALVLVFMPLAVLVCLPVLQGRDRLAWHCAYMLSGFGRSGFVAASWWRYRGGPAFWLWALLTYLASQEVLVTHLLAPAGMPTAPSRLYNFMHYGHTAILSARLLVMLALPALALAAAYLVLRGLAAVLMRWRWEPQSW